MASPMQWRQWNKFYYADADKRVKDPKNPPAETGGGGIWVRRFRSKGGCPGPYRPGVLDTQQMFVLDMR